MRFLGALAVAGVLGLVVYVLVNAGSITPGGPRPTFDPLTTDPAELRRVAEAVSRIIAAPPDQHLQALETLESLRVESAGAHDLRDSCIATYRGMIRATTAVNAARAIMFQPDGGERSMAQINPTERVRAEQLLTEGSEARELVVQSEGRCLDLYQVAVNQLHLSPTRPPARPPPAL